MVLLRAILWFFHDVNDSDFFMRNRTVQAGLKILRCRQVRLALSGTSNEGGGGQLNTLVYFPSLEIQTHFKVRSYRLTVTTTIIFIVNLYHPTSEQK